MRRSTRSSTPAPADKPDAPAPKKPATRAGKGGAPPADAPPAPAADGALTITYFKKDAGAVGSLVETKTTEGKVTKTEYDFRPLPAPK